MADADRAPRLLTFNPETDFALASGLTRYTAPANIRAMRRRLSLLPALFARHGDHILVDADMTDDEVAALPYFSVAARRGVIIVRDAAGAEYESVVPWGWDGSIRGRLAAAGADPALLPSPEKIMRLRELSHRRLTISFNRGLNARLGIESPLPEEISSMAEAEKILRRDRDCYFKSPWSSSGRGVMAQGTLSLEKERQWVSGAIRRQGSVMTERRCRRVIDFATEWMAAEGKCRFLGFSVFATSPTGGYKGNVILPQRQLEELIDRELHPIRAMQLADAQREVSEKLIAPRYSGPFGIDCCSDGQGDLRGCLEVNLRHTMGMASLCIPPLPSLAGISARPLFLPLQATVAGIDIDKLF